MSRAGADVFDQQSRLIYAYDVGGERRRADPLDVRRRLLRESGGRFFTWLAEAYEPGENESGPLPPPETMTADPEGPAAQAAKLAEAHRASKLMAALAAQERVVAVAREAFGLPAFDPATGAGLLEADVWAVLNGYLDFMEGNGSAGGN